MNRIALHNGFRRLKRLFIAIIGFTVLLIGLILLILPGPALLVIPIGLAILATEFVWAQKTLSQVKKKAAEIKSSFNSKSSPQARPRV